MRRSWWDDDPAGDARADLATVGRALGRRWGVRVACSGRVGVMADVTVRAVTALVRRVGKIPPGFWLLAVNGVGGERRLHEGSRVRRTDTFVLVYSRAIEEIEIRGVVSH